MLDLQAVKERYGELLVADPTAAQERNEAFVLRQRAERACFGDRPLCPVLRPHFVLEETYRRLEGTCRHLMAALRRLAKEQLRGGDWAKRSGLTPEAAQLVSIEPGFDSLGVTTRLDAFASGDDLFFVELNAEAPAGTAYHDALATIFDELGPIDALRREGLTISCKRVVPRLLQALLTTWRDWSGGAGRPRIAIVDWKHSPTAPELALLAETFSRRGYPTVVADPTELDCHQGRLFARSGRVDLVYRRVLFGECLRRSDEVRPLVEAVATGAVCMANPFRAAMFHRKRIFAALTDPEFIKQLPTVQQRAVNQHIPWTRLLRDERTSGPEGEKIELLQWTAENRTRLVLKPDHGYGGDGVRLGWLETDSSWQAAIQDASQRPSIIQQRVPTQLEAFPLVHPVGATGDFLVDRAPYVFRGRMGGFLTRLATGPLANVTAGGGMVPTYVVRAH